MTLRAPWTTQPLERVGPSPELPAPLALINGAVGPVNLAGGGAITTSLGTPAALDHTAFGRGLRMRGRARAAGYDAINGRYEAILAVVRVETAATAGTLIAVTSSSLGFSLGISASRFRFNVTSNNGSLIDSSADLVNGGTYAVMAWCAGTASTQRFIACRRLDTGGPVEDVTGTSVNSANVNIAASWVYLGELVNGAASEPSASVLMAAAWRPQSPFARSRVWELLGNPWQVFEPRALPLASPAGGTSAAAPGANVSAALELIAGAASGQVNGVAGAATVQAAAALSAGVASGQVSAIAAGSSLQAEASLSAGAASGASAGVAAGATMSAQASLAAGAAAGQVSASAEGALVAASASLSAGAAAATGAAAQGALMAVAAAIVPGAATGSAAAVAAGATLAAIATAVWGSAYGPVAAATPGFVARIRRRQFVATIAGSAR